MNCMYFEKYQELLNEREKLTTEFNAPIYINPKLIPKIILATTPIFLILIALSSNLTILYSLFVLFFLLGGLNKYADFVNRDLYLEYKSEVAFSFSFFSIFLLAVGLLAFYFLRDYVFTIENYKPEDIVISLKLLNYSYLSLVSCFSAFIFFRKKGKIPIGNERDIKIEKLSNEINLIKSKIIEQNYNISELKYIILNWQSENNPTLFTMPKSIQLATLLLEKKAKTLGYKNVYEYEKEILKQSIEKNNLIVNS